MLTPRDYYAVLNGADQENGPYSLNEETGEMHNSYADLKGKGSGLVQLADGQRVSADRLKYIKENDEVYNRQLSQVMHSVSPYFEDAYTSGITGNIFRPIIGLGEGLQQKVGSKILAAKGSLTSAPARNLQESKWEEYRKNLSPEKTLKLVNFLDKSGGKSMFALSLDANQFIDAASKKRGIQIDDEDRNALLEYHKLLQARMKDEHDMNIFQNYNEAFEGKISDWSPNVNSVFQKSFKTLGNVVGDITVNMALSAIPYVGSTAAMGLSFSEGFYTKRIEGLEKGWDLDKANFWAMTQGMKSAIIERISIKGLQRAFLTSSRSIRNIAFNYMLPEAGEEGLDSLVESFIDNYTGLNIKDGTEIVRDAALSMLLGAFGGSFVGTFDFSAGQISSRIEALQRDAKKLGIDNPNRKRIEKDIQTLKEIVAKMPKQPGLPTVEMPAQQEEDSLTPMSERKLPGPVVREKVGEQEVWRSADTMDTLVTEEEGADIPLKPLTDTTKEEPKQIGDAAQASQQQKPIDTTRAQLVEAAIGRRTKETNQQRQKVEEFYKNLEDVIRKSALKKNPNLTEQQLDALIAKAYIIAHDPKFQGSVVNGMYNAVDQMVKRANWANDVAKENILELEELLAISSDNKALKERMSKSLNILLNKPEYKKFKAALEELSATIKRDLEKMGLTSSQADILVSLYEGLFYETALKSGLTPSEIYEHIKPTFLNMNRARLNGQQGLASSILDNVKKSNIDTDIDTALIETRQTILELRKAVVKKNKEKTDSVNNSIYGETESAPSPKQTLNALTTQAVAQQKIHEDMGVLQDMKEEEWLVFALMKEKGYTETELLAAYGVNMPNAETAYNDSLGKLFPALNAEEIQKLNKIKESLLKNKKKQETQGGVYSTEENAVYVAVDAPLSTGFHEVAHGVIFQAMVEAKQRHDMGIDFNTDVDRLVRKVNSICKKRYGEFPNERQFQETIVDVLQDYYIDQKSADAETAHEIVSAVEESENASVSNAASLYKGFSDQEKQALKNEVGALANHGKYRTYRKNIEKSYELEDAIYDKSPEQILSEIKEILSDPQNPLKGSTGLEFQLIHLQTHPEDALLGAYDLAFRVSNALRITAAQQYIEEQLDAQESSNPFKEGQVNVFKGFYSGALALPWDYWKQSEIPLAKRLALSEKYIKDSWGEVNVKRNISQLKNAIKRWTFSVYAHANDFSPALGSVAREAMYKMGKLQQKSYDRVSKFQDLLRKGCKKHGITNEQYWNRFKLPYLQSTKEGYEQAKAFVAEVAGPAGVKAMEDIDAMMEEFSILLAEAGVEIGSVQYFAPRRIKDYDKFKEHLGQDIKHPLYNIIKDMREKGASEEEINNTINACFYNRQKWENHKVTGFQRRRVLAIKPQDLSFYEDPFDAMVSYIDDTSRTLMMRELFGYAQKNVLGEQADTTEVEKNAHESFLEGHAMEMAKPLFTKLDKIKTKSEAVAFIKSTGMSVERFLRYYTDKKSLSDASFEDLMVGLYDGYAYSKVDEYKKEQTVIDAAKNQTNLFMADYMKKRADANLSYGYAGKIIKQAVEAGKTNREEAQAVINALQSLGKRTTGNVRLIDSVRALNTLTVIGSKITSTIANLKELSLCAWRFGLVDTLRGAKAAIQDGDRFLGEIGLPKLQEAFRPQTDDQLKRANELAMKWNFFSIFDSKVKATVAFSALKNSVSVLQKGDKSSQEYQRLQRLLDRTFAFSPDYDIDGKMAARRAQVEEDIKNNNVTDDVKFFLFNVVSDQQPINALEVPVGYNEVGSLGKMCYQFSTVQLKQFEFLSRELYDTWKRHKGPSWELAGRLLSFAGYAALFGVPTEWLRDIIRGQKLKPLGPAAVLSITEFAFLSSYFIMDLKRNGPFDAIVHQFTPQFAVLTDGAKDITKNIFGKGKLKDMRILRNFPFCGELVWFWIGGGRAYTKGTHKAYSLEDANIADDVLPTMQFLGSF